MSRRRAIYRHHMAGHAGYAAVARPVSPARCNAAPRHEAFLSADIFLARIDMRRRGDFACAFCRRHYASYKPASEADGIFRRGAGATLISRFRHAHDDAASTTDSSPEYIF